MKIIVNKILMYLAYHPDDIVTTTEDSKCIPLLTALGLINQFERSDTEALAVMSCDPLTTHFLIGMCWSGYSCPNGNGYQTYFLPKSKFSNQEVSDFVRFIVKTHGGHDQQFYVTGILTSEYMN